MLGAKLTDFLAHNYRETNVIMPFQMVVHKCAICISTYSLLNSAESLKIE